MPLYPMMDVVYSLPGLLEKRASPRGECQAKRVLRLTRLTKIFWKSPLEKKPIYAKPAFAWSRDLLLHQILPHT